MTRLDVEYIYNGVVQDEFARVEGVDPDSGEL